MTATTYPSAESSERLGFAPTSFSPAEVRDLRSGKNLCSPVLCESLMKHRAASIVGVPPFFRPRPSARRDATCNQVEDSTRCSLATIACLSGRGRSTVAATPPSVRGPTVRSGTGYYVAAAAHARNAPQGETGRARLARRTSRSRSPPRPPSSVRQGFS